MDWKAISEEAAEVLSLFAKKHGLTVRTAGVTIAPDDSNATLEFEFAAVGESGLVEGIDATNFKLYAKSFGLSVNDLGKEFEYGGVRYRIIGSKPRSKRPITAVKVTSPDSKTYFAFTAEQVKSALSKK